MESESSSDSVITSFECLTTRNLTDPIASDKRDRLAMSAAETALQANGEAPTSEGAPRLEGAPPTTTHSTCQSTRYCVTTSR